LSQAEIRIEDTDVLFRRILCPEHFENGIVKPEAFYISINKKKRAPDNDISTKLSGPGRATVDQACEHPRRQAGCASVEAAFPRTYGLTVRHTPTPTDAWHASIIGVADLTDSPNPREMCIKLAEEMSRHIERVPPRADDG
jgi:hypothetical protein